MRNAAKVLIVDDDKSSSALLSEVVRRIGLKPVVASKAADALNVVKLQSIDAALVDVLLPKTSGVDLTAEFRKTKFGSNPVVLVSGVFKDKNFASEAIKKSGALDFLFKPFGADELKETLKRVFAPLLATEAWDVQALLTRRLPTARDRAKAIEHLTRIKGPDFTFVLGLLARVGISGHLNIVNDSGEIFGVTLAQGMVSEVDSSESKSTGILALVSGGFLSQEDWEEFQRNQGKRFTLEKLVSEGLVSPHAVDFAKHSQILEDFKAICTSENLQVNFVPSEEALEPSKHAVGIKELIQLLFQTAEEFFPEKYLEDFYQQNLETPIRLNVEPEALLDIVKAANFLNLKDLGKLLSEGPSLNSLIAHYENQRIQVFLAAHALLLDGVIYFEDANQVKDLQDMLERYQKVYKELKDLSPEDVFVYFGAPRKPSEQVVKTIFDSYLRSNNPEALSVGAPRELVELSHKCFHIVRNAFEILTNEEKRQAFYDKQKKAVESKTRESKELLSEGLSQLKKGLFEQSVATLREAGKHNPSTTQFLILTWAEMKAGVNSAKPQLLETLKKLESLPNDDKRSAYYLMATGLVKKALGDITAQTYFEKAYQSDSSFVEARRELNALTNARESAKDKRVDLLTGDITAIVSQLFRRKSE